MKALTVDARGLACPLPVVRVKKALEGMCRGPVVVLVDDPVAKENVLRFAAYAGCSHRCDQQGQGCRITIERPGDSGERS